MQASVYSNGDPLIIVVGEGKDTEGKDYLYLPYFSRDRREDKRVSSSFYLTPWRNMWEGARLKERKIIITGNET